MDNLLQGLGQFGPYALMIYTHYLMVSHTLKYDHKLRKDI